MKLCNKCKKEKGFNDFYRDKSKKDGVATQCKTCKDKVKNKYTELNKEKIKKNKKEYYQNNKEKIKEKSKKWEKDNKERVKKRSKSYREKNKEKAAEYNKNYREKNKKKLNEYQKNYGRGNRKKLSQYNVEYVKSRKNTDIIFKLRMNMSSLVRVSLKSGGYKKTSRTHKIIGCSFEMLINHLNNNDYGFMYGDSRFDIDHIIPVSSAISKNELLSLNHYSNLQLLPSYYNQHIKKNKPFDKLHFECWYKNEINN